MTLPATPPPPVPGPPAPLRATNPSAPVWFLRVLLAFLRRDLLEASRYRMAFVTRFFGFVLAALSLYFFSRFVGTSPNSHLAPYGGDYLSFGLCGIMAAQLQQVGVTTLANRVRMAQLMGHLEAQLSTPAPAWIVLGTQPVYELAAALGRAVLYVLGAAMFLGVTFHPNLATLAIGVPLALVTFGGVGLLGAAATMMTRRSNPVGALLGGASALLSGVVYPVSVLPGWLAEAGRYLPLTHGLEILRKGLLAGVAPAEVAGSLLALAGFALAFLVFGLGLFAWALRRARVDGSLSHF
jgi:ABC-2 type transport system permease protein